MPFPLEKNKIAKINLKDRFPALIFLVGLFLFWQVIVTYFQIPSWLLPSPLQVGEAFWSTRSLLWTHTVTTMIETLSGFILSVILALVLGVLMDLFPMIKRIFYPYLIISQTIPLIAVAPLLILWLGYGLLPKIIIVVLVCFFPIIISLLEGLEVSDPDLVILLKSMGASRWQMLYHIKWPHSLPSLFAGLKIAATYSVMAAVIGEWLGASSGLGVYLTRSSHSFLTDRVFASIIAITLLSLIYFLVIIGMTKLLIPWQSSKN